MAISADFVKHIMSLNAKDFEFIAPDKSLFRVVYDQEGIKNIAKTLSNRVNDNSKPMLIPMPVKVRSYNNRATVLWFADNTFTKCVVDEGTPYDLDTGITICLFKKMLGADGTKKYHKMMRFVHDGMEEEKKEREAKLALKKLHREENARMKAKADARKAKRRQEQIDIQKEAYLQAFKEYVATPLPPIEEVQDIVFEDIPDDSEFDYKVAKSFVNDAQKLIEEDLNDQSIAEKMGFSSVSNYRKHRAKCIQIIHEHDVDIYRELRAKGMSRKQIAIELGLNESTIRGLANYVMRVDKDGANNE